MSISLIRRPATTTFGGEITPDLGSIRLGPTGVLTFGTADLGYSNFHAFNGSIVIGSGDPASLASASGSGVTTFQAFGANSGRSGGLRLMSSDSSLAFDMYGATSDSATQPFAIGTTSNHGWRMLANGQNVANVTAPGLWAFGPAAGLVGTVRSYASALTVGVDDFDANGSFLTIARRSSATKTAYLVSGVNNECGLEFIGRAPTTAATFAAGSYTSAGGWILGPATATFSLLHQVYGSLKLSAGGSKFTARYTIDDTYAASLSWRTVQLGNNGSNIIAAGNTTAGGVLEFYTNVTNTNDGGNWTPNGLLAMTLGNNGQTVIGNGSTTNSPLLTVNNGAIGNTASFFLIQRSNSSIASFTYVSANTSMNISNTTVTAPSDIRLKEDFQSFDALAMVDLAAVFDFKWKSSASRSLGFKAQEMPAILAYVVNEGDADPDTIETPWGINYAGLVPVLWRAVQQLKARVETLENA